LTSPGRPVISDYNIAVFIKDPGSLSAELHRLACVSKIFCSTPVPRYRPSPFRLVNLV
jgi:hypothetical protein